MFDDRNNIFLFLKTLFDFLNPIGICVFRCDGARSFHSNIFAHITEVPLLQQTGPRSVASSGRGHGQRCEEELRGLRLLQWHRIWDWKGMTRTRKSSECVF